MYQITFLQDSIIDSNMLAISIRGSWQTIWHDIAQSSFHGKCKKCQESSLDCSSGKTRGDRKLLSADLEKKKKKISCPMSLVWYNICELQHIFKAVFTQFKSGKQFFMKTFSIWLFNLIGCEKYFVKTQR